MLESFSKRAVELIETAKNLVKINNETNSEDYVTTFYLLLAMYNANDTICHFLLNELEIEYNDLIEEYKKEEVFEQPSKVFTKEFEQLVIDASILSKEVGSEYVYDEHLFYTMLCNKKYSGTKILLNLNVDIEQLKQDIIDIFNFYKEEVLILDKEQVIKPNYLINLSKEESLHKYIERKDYLNQLLYILSKRQKNNPLLIGQAGIGKTQLVSALSKKLNQDIYELDLGSLISGTKYRGEMEEKLVNAIKYVINQNAILFIDEVHNIVGAGSNDGSLDVANILKPYLSKGKLKLIAATTLDEYYKYIEKDKALIRRFQTIFIDEPSLEETKNILMGIKDIYENHYQVYIEERLIDYIIELADNYILNKTFPDKAIDILDETLSRYKLLGINIYQLVKDVISSHEGINIPTLEELNNYKLYYNELKLLYLRRIKPIKSLKNMGIVLANNTFNFDLLKKDLEKVFSIKKEHFLELDLNDYQKAESISNLIGSSKGYVGYDDGGILLNHLMKYPFSIVYLKNYHLSNSIIKLFFKNLFNKHYIIDSHSRYIYLKSVLFIIDENINSNSIGFIENSKNNNLNYDIVITSIHENTSELLNNLLKRGIIIEGFKNLKHQDQINIYYQAIQKPIGKYQINQNKILEMVNTN